MVIIRLARLVNNLLRRLNSMRMMNGFEQNQKVVFSTRNKMMV